MNLWSHIKQILNPRPHRDPKVDRVLSVNRQTQQRRQRSHASLMASLAERVDDDEHERRVGHSD